MILAAQFKQYLEEQNLSPVSIKNYLSDINKFLEWVSSKKPKTLQERQIRQLADAPATEDFPTSSDFQVYYQYLLDQQTPLPSLKRYLSSLRRFGEFLKACGELANNPADDLADINQPLSSANTFAIEKLLDEFAQSLEKEKLSPVTIKNYLTDTRQFLHWFNYQNGS